MSYNYSLFIRRVCVRVSVRACVKSHEIREIHEGQPF